MSGIKLNKSKCEIAGIGALRGVQVALCGMRCNNDKLEIQENFKKHIIKIEKKLRIWSMIDLSIAGKITMSLKLLQYQK